MSIGSLLRSTPGVTPSEPLRPGSYVTDGCRLFRVVSQFATVGEHVFASLENCSTLEVQSYVPGELCAMNLRPVHPVA
jgi:hypothetical protein